MLKPAVSTSACAARSACTAGDGAWPATAVIMYSCSVAAMAPATNIGAAHPVGVAGAIEESKVTNDAVAYIQGLARARDRDASWAADAVRNQAQNAIANTARGGASAGASLSTKVESMIPLSDIAHYAPGLTPLSVNHQGPFVATTFSFSLPEGEPLGTAVDAIQRTMAQLHVPISVHGEFAGNARDEFQF